MYRLGTTCQLTVENIDATGAPRLMRRAFRKHAQYRAIKGPKPRAAVKHRNVGTL